MNLTLPVPEDLVPDLLRLVADFLDERSKAGQMADIAGLWDVSTEPFREFLDFLAARPGKPISRPDLAGALGVEPEQINGMLGGMNRHFGAFGRPYSRTVRRVGGRIVDVLYRMSPEVADEVRRVSALSEEPVPRRPVVRRTRA